MPSSTQDNGGTADLAFPSSNQQVSQLSWVGCIYSLIDPFYSPSFSLTVSCFSLCPRHHWYALWGENYLPLYLLGVGISGILYEKVHAYQSSLHWPSLAVEFFQDNPSPSVTPVPLQPPLHLPPPSRKWMCDIDAARTLIIHPDQWTVVSVSPTLH